MEHFRVGTSPIPNLMLKALDNDKWSRPYVIDKRTCFISSTSDSQYNQNVTKVSELDNLKEQ